MCDFRKCYMQAPADTFTQGYSERSACEDTCPNIVLSAGSHSELLLWDHLQLLISARLTIAEHNSQADNLQI